MSPRLVPSPRPHTHLHLSSIAASSRQSLSDTRCRAGSARLSAVRPPQPSRCSSSRTVQPSVCEAM